MQHTLVFRYERFQAARSLQLAIVLMADGLVNLSVGVRLSSRMHSPDKLFVFEPPFDLKLSNPKDPDTIHQWMFPHIYSAGSSHQEIFATLLGPQVEHTLIQGNSCCLVYGQADSGKTTCVFGEEGLLELMLKRVVTEIKSEEKGVKAAIACLEVRGAMVRDLFKPITSESECELKDHMGLFGVPDTTWVNIKTVAEPLNIIREAVRLRSEQVQPRPHFFILLTISRYKTVLNAISSIILADISTFQPLEADSLSNSINHTSLQSASLVILGKLISELCYESRDESILTAKSMNGEWDLALLACVYPSEDQFQACLNTLKFANKAQSYPATLKKLRKKEFKEASADNKLILQLRSDIIDLKFDLQHKEVVHSKQLKELGLKLGLDFDLNLLKDMDESSREGRAVKSLREGLERSDVYKQMKLHNEERNRGLEGKVEEARARAVAATKRNHNHLADFQEEVRIAKLKIDEIVPELPEKLKAEAESLQLELDTGTQELQTLSTCMNELYSVAASRSEAAEMTVTQSRNGRDSIEAQMRKEYKSEEDICRRTIAATEKDYENRIKEKNGQRSLIEAQMRKIGIMKTALCTAFSKECGGLAWIAKQQRDLIDSIQQGDYNNGVVPVVIPRGHRPDFPVRMVEKQ